MCTNRSPGLLLRVGDAEAHAVARSISAGVADLAAGLAVERRLVEHDARRPRRPSRSATSLPSRTSAATSPSASRCRSRGTRWRRPSRAARTRRPRSRPRRSPPRPRAPPRAGCSMAASKPSRSTAMPRGLQRVLGQVEREAVGVVEREGDRRPCSVSPRFRARRSPRRAGRGRAPASCGSASPRACSVSVISASARTSSG